MKDEIENIGLLLLKDMYSHGFSKSYDKDLTQLFSKRKERDVKDAVKYLYNKGYIHVFGIKLLSHDFFIQQFSGHVTDLGVLTIEKNELYDEDGYTIEIVRFLQVIDESDEDHLQLDEIIPKIKKKGSIRTEEELKNIISTTLKYTCNVKKYKRGKGIYAYLSVVNTTSPITEMGMSLLQDYIKKTKVFTNSLISNRDMVLKEYGALEILIKNQLWKDACIKMGSILEYLLTKWLESKNVPVIYHSQNNKQQSLDKAHFYDKIRFYIETGRIDHKNEIGNQTQWEIVNKVIREYRNYIHLQNYEKKIALDGYLGKNDFELLNKPFNQIVDFFQ